MKSIVAGFLCLSSWASCSWAATYYVALNGNDENDGTSSPCAYAGENGTYQGYAKPVPDGLIMLVK